MKMKMRNSELRLNNSDFKNFYFLYLFIEKFILLIMKLNFLIFYLM